jgi:uncharacterized membrane protein YphA (DoxX/SURF4 family)
MKLYLALVRFLTHPWTGLLFRLIAGIVFVYASYDKLLHPEAFLKIVHNYRILPPALETMFALTLPWMEFLVGLLLILGLLTEASALLNCVLLVAFLIAIPSALIRHIDITCGCFSTIKSVKIGMDLVYRDILLLIPALLILFFPSRFLALDSFLTKRKVPSS